MQLFVTHTKKNLGNDNFKAVGNYRKTGDLETKLPFSDLKNTNIKPKLCKKSKKSELFFENSLFRKYYDRGDLPAALKFNGPACTLKWLKEPTEIDLQKYLPLFIHGLTEDKHPYEFLAEQGSVQIINTNPDKIADLLSEIIIPLKRSLDSENSMIVLKGIKLIQAMLKTKPSIATDLVPYFKNILPAFGRHIKSNLNIGDQIEYSQSKKQNLGDLIKELLEILEINGGPEAFAHIKYMIPSHQSVKN